MAEPFQSVISRIVFTAYVILIPWHFNTSAMLPFCARSITL